MNKKIIKQLQERQAYSFDYWKETYPTMRNIDDISGAESIDNMSWELGFYEGMQYAIDMINKETS